MWSNQDEGGFQQGGGFGDQSAQGGYMNTPDKPNSSQGPSRSNIKRSQNVLPCTVAQLLASDQDGDAYYTPNGVQINQITLVGLVRAAAGSSTKLEYQIDDMTARPLQVLQFVDNDENTPEEERTVPMKQNMYVRVYGHLRSFNNKRNVVAFKVLPVTDMNELTSHLLETVHSHMYLVKSSGGAAPGGNTSTQQGGEGQQQGQGGYSGAQPDQGLTHIQSQVQAVIRSCPDEEGISIQDIAKKLQGIPERALREAAEFLSGEGHIYSTIDDDHYKSTDSM